MKKIVFVDDEPNRIIEYYEEIEFGVLKELVYFEDLSDANKFISENINEIELLIIDIMFDNVSPKEFSGISAGKFFYEQLKKRFKHLPVIILTNRTEKNIIEFVRFVRNNNDVFQEKIHITPTHFLDIVKSKINNYDKK